MQLNLSLEADSDLPVYKQMAEAIIKAITEGALSHGQVMPSSRELADCMSVSRLTARRCYEELSGQGYIKTHDRGKTHVNSPNNPINLTPNRTREAEPIQLSVYGRRLAEIHEADESMKASKAFGATPESQLPITRFQECLYEAVREIGSVNITSQRDSFGLLALRKQLQALLFRTRGIQCSAEQIVLFPTTEGGVDLLCRVTLSEDDLVATEDPGLASIRTSLELNGARVCPIPVDQDGISMEALGGLERTPRLIYVTPSRQDTTGRMMTRFRRHRLLQWLASEESLIVEDDYDSEFRYGQEPQPAMFSLDTSGRVIYRYNFWKSLYPLVKLSFMVIPESLIPSFRGALNSLNADIPMVEQLALATFIRKGHYERHLHRCRKVYAVRRASMIYALTKLPGRPVSFEQQTGGTHIIVRFAESLSAEQIESAAEEIGLEIYSTRKNYALVDPPTNEYLLSFSNINEAETETRINQFMQLMQPQKTATGIETTNSSTNLAPALAQTMHSNHVALQS
jgi:GntR family transcriptional regulator / MocR family aminotransferase